VLETVPEEANQVTARLDVLVTRAVNWVDAPEGTVAVVGVMVTITLGALVTVIAKACPPAWSEGSVT
jgi:hypothetical protein